MAGERAEGSKPPGEGGIAAELVAAGFLDAVEVGRGGAGIVYRCHQTSLARSVAIKVLMSDFDQDSRERFLREGLAMGKLSGHPNIENILQVGVTETNRPYIVMPYHQAGSLAQRLHRVGRIAWPDALRIAVKLCGALETAHLTGTLHRDIKPGNVLVNDYGEPQLSDFGIARILGGYETATGFFTGTIAFTAPEVLAGSPPTAVSDVYSLDRRDCRARAQERRGSHRALPSDQFDARAGHASSGNPSQCVRRDREGDVAGSDGTARVRGGLRPRNAVGAASQRVDGGFDGP
jgi:serine/threonine protein kinase